MTHLKVASALHTLAGGNNYYTNLLTDMSKKSRDEQSEATARPPKAAPMNPSISNGTYAHIEAQILAGSTQRSFRRPTANSPRDAARAYGQARRRPQMVSDQPRLQSVV